MSDVPKGWKIQSLSKVARIVSGGTPSRYVPEFWDGGTIPWATPTDLTNAPGRYLYDTREHITELGLQSCGAKLLPSASLLMTSRATLGEVKFSTGAVCTNQGFKSLVPFNGIDPNFLFYQLGLNKERYRSLGIGSTFLEVNKRDTERFELLIAPEPEQHHIAEILSTLDVAIEQTEALIAKYQQVKSGLVQDLFTRGVTSDGRLRPPRSEASRLYKESPLRWIPREWDVLAVREMFARRVERGRPGLPVMAITKAGGLVERRSVDRRVDTRLGPEGHLLVRSGDIAYNMMRMWQGVLGRAISDCLVSPAYIVLQPGPMIDSIFAEYLFSTDEAIAAFKRRSYGVVDDRLRLYFRDLARIRFAIPVA
jgi:restriction endonuclease S subunit